MWLHDHHRTHYRVYQVGFSLAHFAHGYTGLTISVLAAVTLFVLMMLTGRIRWSSVFAKRDSRSLTAPALARSE
jgi:hypothetical protein